MVFTQLKEKVINRNIQKNDLLDNQSEGSDEQVYIRKGNYNN